MKFLFQAIDKEKINKGIRKIKILFFFVKDFEAACAATLKYSFEKQNLNFMNQQSKIIFKKRVVPCNLDHKNLNFHHAQVD
jgi:uncharacterized protein YlbG (UPF0298 family)